MTGAEDRILRDQTTEKFKKHQGTGFGANMKNADLESTIVWLPALNGYVYNGNSSAIGHQLLGC